MERAVSPFSQEAPPAFIPREHAVLPEGGSKASLLALIDEVGRRIGLNATDVQVLRRLAMKTRASDYTDPLASPMCYERQIDMARQVGLSDVQFRRVERKLESLRFIDRNTAANGYRGRLSGSLGMSSCAGISLEPLVARYDELTAIREDMRNEAETASHYRMEISILRRRLRHLAGQLSPEHPLSVAYQEAHATWETPRSYRTTAALAEHFFELEALVDEIEKTTVSERNMTGAAVKNDRCHKHYTAQNKTESCNGQPLKRPACKQADTEIDCTSPIGSARCEEKKNEASGVGSKSEFIENLTLDQLRGLCSENMLLYVDHLRASGTPRTALDYEQAALHMGRDLRIGASALEQAQERMSWKEFVVTVIVLDRNQNHPTSPIRSPGGAMRAFTKLHDNGKLDLRASVFGIWGRDGTEH